MSPIEWVGAATGVLAVLASVLKWHVVTGQVAELAHAADLPAGRTAWGAGFSAWFPMVLLILAAALVVAPVFGLRVPFVPVLWLLCALVAVIVVIVGWATMDPPDPQVLTAAGLDPQNSSTRAGFGLYLGLLTAVVSGAAALIAFRAAPRRGDPA